MTPAERRQLDSIRRGAVAVAAQADALIAMCRALEGAERARETAESVADERTEAPVFGERLRKQNNLRTQQEA